MQDEHLERIETKIAFLEKANADLGDVVYAQQSEIRALHARLNALSDRLEAVQYAERERSADDERPPHY
jgi:SlyX protein